MSKKKPQTSIIPDIIPEFIITFLKGLATVVVIYFILAGKLPFLLSITFYFGIFLLCMLFVYIVGIMVELLQKEGF